MRRAARFLASGLAIAAAVTALGARAGGVASTAGQTSMNTDSDREKFVGTYRLVTIERRDAAGTWTPTPNFTSFGYITYSDTGYMGVQYMPANRTPFASNRPTPAEALSALRGYLAYYGTWTVDEKGGFVLHRRAGDIDPNAEGDAKRFYDLVGNRLILTPTPLQGGSKGEATNRVVWERLPNRTMSAEEKKFVGVRTLLYEDTYTEEDGREVFHGSRNEGRTGSYLIYTPTGHMMAHLMDRAGRTRYGAGQPTPDEALKNFGSYRGSFGRFTVFGSERPPYLVHNQEGTTTPGGQHDARRFYEFKGNVLRLSGPPSVNAAGETEFRHMYWESLPPLTR